MEGLQKEVNQLIDDNGLRLCLECGKCSAVCPMPEVYGKYNYDSFPRGIVERLLFGFQDIQDEAFWYCLTCEECTSYCPVGVTFQRFMTEFRELLIHHGNRKYAVFCPACGSYLMPRKEFEYIKNVTDGKKKTEYLSECPRCRKKSYAETLHQLDPWAKKLRKSIG